MTSKSPKSIDIPETPEGPEPARPIPGICDRAQLEAERRLVGRPPAPANSQASEAA